MPATVAIEAVIPEAWNADARVEVFTDQGSGTVDMTRPMPGRAAAVFPGQRPAQGFGKQPWGLGGFGTGRASRPPHGIETSKWGKTAWGTAPPVMNLTVKIPSAFGLWKFALQAVDDAGRVQSGAAVEVTAMVSGEHPAPPATMSLNSYDAPNDQVVFDFSLTTE